MTYDKCDKCGGERKILYSDEKGNSICASCSMNEADAREQQEWRNYN